MTLSPLHSSRTILEDRVNSSRTWKTGEMCRVSGTYRCQNCHFAGREVLKEFQAGKVLPMCDVSPDDKDVTWVLLKPAASVKATA